MPASDRVPGAAAPAADIVTQRRRRRHRAPQQLRDDGVARAAVADPWR
jgi:hypothetical protein